MDLPLPDTIGPYRILRAIARGGMAEVYEVEDPLSGEHLALKLLVQQGLAGRRFNREYEAMIRLNHPNIVRVYHYGLNGEQPWLTMELLQGTPVQAYAKHLGRPGAEERTREVIRIAHDVARALDHIHRRGLVHRDLKSANVLVLSDRRVKLLDFGSAKVIDAERITREGEFVGTFAYAAPEQLMGKPVGHESDLYSLGVLLYRMTTGRRPFETEDLREMARLHIKVPPRPPSELVEVPPELERIILSLLEKAPDRRPRTGEEVAVALERLAGAPLILPGTLEMYLSEERLVGREEQLALCRSFLDECKPAALAMLIGLEGSGRTRMGRAVEREARSRDWTVFSCQLEPERDLARLGLLLRKIAKSLAGGEPPPEAKQAIRILDKLQRNPGLTAIRRREYMRTAGVSLLAARARVDQRPVLVSLYGMHHAGPTAFDLIVGLREGLELLNAPVVFCGEFDAADDGPEVLARKRIPDALRIALPPLDEGKVSLLVGSLLHRRPPTAALARRIHRASGGLPVYVEDVVQGMVDSGILMEQGRDPNRLEWAAREQMAIPVPQRAQTALVETLGRLPVVERRFLEALAVFGGEGDLVTLAHGIDRAAGEIREEVRSLRAAGWIDVVRNHTGGETVSWRRRLAQDVVMGGLNDCRRALLERRLVDSAVRGPPRPAQVTLLLAVGKVDEALRLAMVWAEQFIEALRPVAALEVLEPAIERLETMPSEASSGELGRAHLMYATCLLLVRPLDPRSRRSLDIAEESGGSAVFRARVALTRAEQQRAIGHYPNYRKRLGEAWEAIAADPPPRMASGIALRLAETNALSGLTKQANDWYEQAWALASSSGNVGVKARAEVGQAQARLAAGDLLGAEQNAVSALEVFDRIGDMEGVSLALPVWVESLRHQGRFSQALEVLGSVSPEYRSAESPSLYVRLLVPMAECEVDICRLGRAQECVDELAAIVRPGEHLHLRLRAHLVWGRILLASGNRYEAGEVLTEVCNKGHAAGLVVISEHARALLAETLWEAGERHHARKHFEQAFKVLARAGDVPALMEACMAAGRAMGEAVRPDSIFAPVAEFLKTQPAEVVRLEWAIAQGRWLARRGRDALECYLQAQETLDRIALGLNDTDRAAIRLHPWSRAIKEGSGSEPPSSQDVEATAP